VGSVKDLKVIKSPSEKQPGIGRFVFSDRYSVFDWGKMPQDIDRKGKALCLAGAYFFERLQERGIETHYRGIVESGRAKKLDELKSPSNIMEVNLYRVFKPRLKKGIYDYSRYLKRPSNVLIPLEVIYRNSLPEGSSIFKRLKNGTVSPREVGFDAVPEPESRLPEPFMDVSTKFEHTDRYIDWDTAADIAGLDEQETGKIKDILLEVNKIITKEAEKMGMENSDGKIELAFNEKREPVVADVLGTPDECRFRKGKISLSKELARIYYRETDWYREVSGARETGGASWKERVSLSPPALPERFAGIISDVYCAFVNELTGRRWFDSPEFDELIDEIQEYI